jgi:hypothetical protein
MVLLAEGRLTIKKSKIAVVYSGAGPAITGIEISPTVWTYSPVNLSRGDPNGLIFS